MSDEPLGAANANAPTDLLADTPLFARVFHHSPVGMVISDTAGRFVAINEALVNILGWPAASLIGHTPVELGLMAADDFRALLVSMRASNRTDVPLPLLDSERRPHSLLASIQHVEIRGRPHTVTLIQDLSEFDRLRDALAQSEQRFRLFFENAPLALVVSDPATNEIVDVNPAACRQYGYTRAQFMALSADSLPPETDVQPGLAQHTTADGRSLDVEVSTFAFDLAERALNMNALLDVTAQMAATAALRDSERTFRIVAQVSNDDLWEWDLVHDRVWHNSSAQLHDRLPHGPAELWLEDIHPDDQARSLADFEQALADGQSGWTSEYRVRRPDGQWAKLLQRGVILYEDDIPVRVIGATVDITEPLQLAEAEAQATQLERDRLARDLHDSVTQSLYSVSLLAEAARRQAIIGRDAETAEFITRLGSLAHQALRQMRLLVYELRPGVLDQEGLIGALRHRLESVEKRAGIITNLITRGERPVPAHWQGELYRIAHEALNNALKYAAATAVTVRVDTLGDNIVLEILDNGAGFNPNASHPGRGLPMMRERCAQLGGDLTILSTPGLGTTVRLILPPTA